MNKIVQTFQYGDQEMRLETGQIARQATGAVLASLGESVVLVTVVAAREASTSIREALECELEAVHGALDDARAEASAAGQIGRAHV